MVNPHDHFVLPAVLSVNPRPSNAAMRLLLAMSGAKAGEVVGSRLPVFLCVFFSSEVMASACALLKDTVVYALMRNYLQVNTQIKHTHFNTWWLRA